VIVAGGEAATNVGGIVGCDTAVGSLVDVCGPHAMSNATMSRLAVIPSHNIRFRFIHLS
jgi:hypothetical protein